MTLNEMYCRSFQKAAADCHKMAAECASKGAPMSTVIGWQEDAALWSARAVEILIVLLGTIVRESP